MGSWARSMSVPRLPTGPEGELLGAATAGGVLLLVSGVLIRTTGAMLMAVPRLSRQPQDYVVHPHWQKRVK